LSELFERISLTTELFESRLYTRLKQLNHLLDTGAINTDLFWVTP
jgi:hypothetical protein